MTFLKRSYAGKVLLVHLWAVRLFLTVNDIDSIDTWTVHIFGQRNPVGKHLWRVVVFARLDQLIVCA